MCVRMCQWEVRVEAKPKSSKDRLTRDDAVQTRDLENAFFAVGLDPALN